MLCRLPGRGNTTTFFYGDKSIEIEEVIDCWLAPEYRYFKVRGGENDIYILRHDELAHRWELTMFQSGKYDDSPLSST